MRLPMDGNHPLRGHMPPLVRLMPWLVPAGPGAVSETSIAPFQRGKKARGPCMFLGNTTAQA